MIRGILKFTVIGVAAGIICYVGLTAYGEIRQTEAAKASESYKLAQAQAENMSQALTDVSNFGAAGQAQSDKRLDPGAQPTAVEHSVPGSFAGIDGNRATSTAGPASEIHAQPTAPPNIAAITDLDALSAEWQPRYNAAKVAYAKLTASISNAKARAADYFARQQAITDRIRDPANQARARQEDERDITLYRQWESKADAALSTAAQIGVQLDDMDAYLQKLRLRADFVFDTSQFQEIPKAISDLNQQLADFQAASENISAATRSPFEVKQ